MFIGSGFFSSTVVSVSASNVELIGTLGVIQVSRPKAVYYCNASRAGTRGLCAACDALRHQRVPVGSLDVLW